MRQWNTLILAEVEQQDPFAAMGSALDLVLLAMMVMVAIYGFYTVIRLKREYMLFPNKFLYPTGCTPENCLDEGAYIDYIIPKLLILSVACLIMAIAYGIRVYVFPEVNNIIIELATIILPFGTLLWYGMIQNKVSKTFW